MPAAAADAPRVLFVGRSRYRIPLDGAEARKFAALGEVLDWHLLARAPRSHHDERTTLLGRSRVPGVDGIAFQLRLPLQIARAIRRLRPHVVIAQDPFVGAAALLARRIARTDVGVVIEVHGDWRTATRLYGRSVRRLLAAPADALAASALRRADAVRAISGYTARLVREAGATLDAVFPTFLDLEPFRSTPPQPLPATPVALFVGALERYKNIDGLLAAWERVHRRLPHARLRLVGSGSLVPLVARAARRDGSIEHRTALTRSGIAAALDGSTCLVLPSRSEGMGRIVFEALARGRPVIATSAGGLPELVHDGENGLLTPVGDLDALEAALLALLDNRKVAVQLGTNAARRAAALDASPAAYARDVFELVALARERRPAEPAVEVAARAAARARA